MTFRHRRHTKRRATSGGFTLAELMIAMVMGLLVALAAVSLANTATSTFFEQARMSGVQATLRAASERLRSDLMRVAFMSTANIQLDPAIARPSGSTGAPYRIAELTNLQGIRIAPSSIRAHTLTSANALAPHELHIAGNLTSDDSYRGQLIAQADGCATLVRLSGLADPAVRRLFNGASDSATRRTMTQVVFTPGERMTPAVTGREYAVQVMDMRGCYHYLTVCGVDESPTQPESVILRLRGGVLTPEQTGGDVCGARTMEEVSIAPVHRVRWDIAVESDARRVGVTEATSGSATRLTRQLMAADGVTEVGPAEVVAQYAVDFKLGLVVDEATAGNPRLRHIDFDAPDTEFERWAGPAATTLSSQGPQRIRSVRYRMAFRTASPDRSAPLAAPGGPPYLVRYSLGQEHYARVRTVISELTLLNQAKASY